MLGLWLCSGAVVVLLDKKMRLRRFSFPVYVPLDGGLIVEAEVTPESSQSRNKAPYVKPL